MSGEVVGILILTTLLVMVLDLGLVVAALLASRWGFGAYLQSAHPNKWTELVPPADRLRALSFSFDISPSARKFRAASADDLGDPKLRKLRRRANKLERLAILGFFCMLGWALIVMLLIAVV